VLDEYIVCPTCTTQLKEPCPQCAKPLSYSWAACPFCATPRRQRGRTGGDEEATVPLPRIPATTSQTTQPLRAGPVVPRPE
jgi:hypothetical protein